MDAFLYAPATAREVLLAILLAATAVSLAAYRYRVRELELRDVRRQYDLKDLAQSSIEAGSNAHTEAVDAMKNMHDNALAHLRSAVAETISECLEQPGDDDKGY